MKLSLSVIVVAIALAELVGMVIFLKGFFPIKAAVPGHATYDGTKFEPIDLSGNVSVAMPPLFGRMVLVLIDALRSDFVVPETSSNMPKMKFVGDLIDRNMTHTFIAKAHPPTVTMPRIKALTTGGIPGFVDVVLNFDSTALLEDNLISQLHRAGRKMVFYGDDTWMRLFPKHFERTDGTTSFFVTDYTEVDNNVTRHLDEELIQTDWDVLILHYLGLDHIGHLASPHSPLVKPKLNEMDAIVQKIHAAVSEQDKRRDKPTLLILCGDHGMTDQGSHGGSSAMEMSTPLVLMSSLYQGGKGSAYIGQVVEQTDVAPTLSALLGVPVPQNSLGTTITQALGGLSMRDRLKASYANAQQIVGVLKENVASYADEQGYLRLARAEELHRQWLQLLSSSTSSVDLDTLGLTLLQLYQHAMIDMRDRVAASLACYDLHAMAVGACLLWMMLIGLICLSTSAGFDLDVTLTSSSVLVFSGSLGLACACHIVVCTSSVSSELLCASGLLSWLLGLVVMVTTGVWVMACVCMVPWSGIKAKLSMLLSQDMLTVFLLAGTITHTLSLLASSFLEEEHQTWYFLTVSIHLLMALHFAIQYLRLDNKDSAPAATAGYMQASHTRPDSGDMDELLYHQQAEPTDSDSDAFGQFMSGVRKRSMLTCLMAVGVTLFLSRVSRIWNRTGDKWAHLPDVGDWLVKPENKIVVSVVCAVSLIITWLCQLVETTSTLCKLLFAVGAMAVYFFRAANGAVSLPGLYDETAVSKGIQEARVVYGVIAIMLVHAVYSLYSGAHSPSYPTTKTPASDAREPVQRSGLRQRRVPGGNSNPETEPVWTQSSEDTSQRQEVTTQVFSHDLLCMWTLLMLLLLRPHNMALVAMATMQSACVRHCLAHIPGLSVPAVTLFYLWLGQAAFFYQGNSNSFSSVDVSAGYIGLVDYSPPLIATLMTLNTYAGPLFWILSLNVVLCERICPHGRCSHALYRWYQACTTALLTRALPVAVYIILVSLQRYHLFVWSVFSPKLLYEGLHTLIMVLVVLGILALSHFSSNQKQ